MAQTKPIPVRLPDDVVKRLDKAATKIGHKRASLMRYLIETWLEEFERKGKLMLPENWEQILQSFDSRRTDENVQAPIGKMTQQTVKFAALGARVLDLRDSEEIAATNLAAAEAVAKASIPAAISRAVREKPARKPEAREPKTRKSQPEREVAREKDAEQVRQARGPEQG
jgi:predicted DNA-binding protein